MNSAILTITCLSLFYFGYRYYSQFLSSKVYSINNQKTPAHEFQDGVDYVPTNKHIASTILIIAMAVLLFMSFVNGLARMWHM